MNNATELKSNQVVKLKNGMFGTVCDFNGKPFQLVFNSFTNPVVNWDEDLKKRSKTEAGRNYDIEEVYDGSSLSNPKEVFSKKFKPDNLKLVWARKD